MYLRLRQSILVSDNIPQSQPIYFSFNQCNIADSVTNNHSLISVETLSKDNNRNIKRKRLDEEIKGWKINWQSDEDVIDVLDSVMSI